MADAARAARLADRIKVIVAQALERRIKDPRVGFVTVTDARVTNDLQHATVYYTVYGDETQREETARALESAKGILRAEVGKNITARLTPTLTFVADEIPADAARLESLLRTAREQDARVAEQAVGAQYAAGEDAYRTSEDEAQGDVAPESRSQD
ncbi:30S ribosome-binding factor RbfA [Kocuria sp. UBA5001]|uniref:30S ribosome-binding factor RbfA n=1 Tax=Kocuria sp. UBA5001 TaxID=1946674 RepID=UPI0025BE6ACC|nr:30S ribosome-binding factor RbfA [Kocuria sp. UBA5001]